MDDKEDNASLNDLGFSSVRRKYKGGRKGRANINYAVVLKANKHEHHQELEEKPIIKKEEPKEKEKEKEKIIIKKESKIEKSITAIPLETSSKIVTKTVIKNENPGKQKDKYIFVKNDKGQSNSKLRYGNELSISKTNEIKSELDSRFNNNKRKANQNKGIKEEITTKTITTTNQTISRQSPEKKDITNIITNKINENSNTPKKIEATTTTTKTDTIISQNSKSAQKLQTSANKITTNNPIINQRDNNRGKSQGEKNEIIKQVNTKEKENKRGISSNQKTEKEKEIKTNQRQNSKPQNQEQKTIIETMNEVSTIKEQSSKKQIQEQKPVIQVTQTINQISSNSYQKHNISRRHNTDKKSEIIKETNNIQTQNNKTQIKKEVNNIQLQNSRNNIKQDSPQKIKEVTTIQKQNSRKPSQDKNQQEKVVKEITTTTAINRRNEENKGITTTTTKTITTANQINTNNKERNSKSREINNSSKLNINKTDNSKEVKNLVTDTSNNNNNNPRFLVNHKSTPKIETTIPIISKNSLKETPKKNLSSMTEINRSRHNLSRITINESSKKPQLQPYILNVRKLDRIQQKERMRIIYTNNMNEKNPIKTNFNHRILVIKNVTRDEKTVADLVEGERNNHRYNYSVNPTRSNLSRKEINVSKNKQKVQVIVSPRKNIIIKSTIKPYKLTYENYVDDDNSNQGNVNLDKKMDININLKNKLNEGESVNNNKKSRNNSSKKLNEIKSNTNKITSITTIQTNMNFERNQSQPYINKEKERNSKTMINNDNNKGRAGKYQIKRNERNITENNKEIIQGSENNEKSGSKIITVKKTEISNGAGNNTRNKFRQETSTTTTTTKIENTNSQNTGEGGSVIRRFKSVRNYRK